MPTYIVLTNYTQKGIEQIKDSPSRLDDIKGLFTKMGAELRAFYLVQGRYDIVVIAEAPDDDVVAKLSLTIGAQGYIRTETLRAYTEDNYRKIISALP